MAPYSATPLGISGKYFCWFSRSSGASFDASFDFFSLPQPVMAAIPRPSPQASRAAIILVFIDPTSSGAAYSWAEFRILRPGIPDKGGRRSWKFNRRIYTHQKKILHVRGGVKFSLTKKSCHLNKKTADYVCRRNYGLPQVVLMHD